MERQEIKYKNNSEKYENKKYHDEEYFESSQEYKGLHFKVLNSLFSCDPIYLCSSSIFWNEVEALSDNFFENISEKGKRDDVVSENGSSSVDDDNSLW